MYDTKQQLIHNVEAVVDEIERIGEEPDWSEFKNCSCCTYRKWSEDTQKFYCAYNWDEDEGFELEENIGSAIIIEDELEPQCDGDDWEADDTKTSQEIEEAIEAWDNGEMFELDGKMWFPDVGAWLDDQLCIEKLIYFGSDKSFAGAEISCCLGGPTVRLNTDDGVVYGQWGSDRYDESVSCSEINDYLEEIYQ